MLAMTFTPDDDRPVVFAVSMLALLVAHHIGDHVLQSDEQAAHKADSSPRGYRAMAGHLAVYHAAAAAVLIGTLTVLGLPLSAWGLVAGLGFSLVTHGVLDRRWPVRAVLRATRSPRFAETTTPVCGMYVADQSLHKLCLLVSAILVATV